MVGPKSITCLGILLVQKSKGPGFWNGTPITKAACVCASSITLGSDPVKKPNWMEALMICGRFSVAHAWICTQNTFEWGFQVKQERDSLKLLLEPLKISVLHSPSLGSCQWSAWDIREQLQNQWDWVFLCLHHTRNFPNLDPSAIIGVVQQCH